MPFLIFFFMFARKKITDNMMKTNILSKLLVMLLCTTLFSCGKDDDGPSSADLLLCKTTWIYEYTEGDVTYSHSLKFTLNGHSGQEVTRERNHTSASETTHTREFTWSWRDASHECLIIEYGAGERTYFENLWLREHYLTGLLGGEEIIMREEGYPSQP